MWSPTHTQVLVKRAKGLKIKGKNGSNDPFVTIGLGKEKFQTSVVEKSAESVEWMEECELKIPSKGNTAEIVLTVLHRNFLGVDEFLGRLALPLSDFDHNEKAKSKWYPLGCKLGQKKSDYRGDIEVKVGFTIVASDKIGGSEIDLSKKKKGSSSSINKVAGNIGGSLMSLGKKPKNIKKLADSVGHKIDKVGGKAKKSLSILKLNKDKKNLDSLPEDLPWDKDAPNQDPGVNSDDDEDIDAVFRKVGGSSVSLNRKSIENTKSSTLPPSKPQRNLGVYQNGTEGNENLFKFDLTIERQEFKSNRNSYEHIKNEPDINENVQDENKERKKRKKEKKSKRKEEEKEKMKEENVRQIIDEFSQPEDQYEFSHQNIKKKETFVEKHKAYSSKMPDYSDTNRHFHTYSDEENEDFVVDDVIETFSSDEEKEVEVVETSQKDTNKQPNYSSDEDDSLDLQSSSSQVTSEVVDKIETRNIQIKEDKIIERNPLKNINIQNTQNVQKSQIEPKKKVETIPDESDLDTSDDNSDEDSNPSSGNKKAETGKGKTVLEENLPLEILNKFNGKSREDLIKMVVNFQNTTETQGKKIVDLEAYIDSLLTRVIEVAPVLLHKDVKGANRVNGMQVFNRDLKRSKFG